MALTIYGTAGSIDVTHWSQLMADAVQPLVPAGLATTAKASSPRTVTVAPGRSYQAGSMAVLDTPTDVTFASNTSGLTRIDLVCIRVDFNAGTVALAVKQGVPAASPLTPAATQTAGGVWETPVARVILANNATQLTSSNIVDARPLRSQRTCSGEVTMQDNGDVAFAFVTFPRGFFTSAPDVVAGFKTGASQTTIANLWVNNETATGCQLNMARTTKTSCIVKWIATGY